MNFVLFRRVVVLSLLVLAAIAGSHAQKVRLRSQITPQCTTSAGNENLKFADLFGDGNIAVLGSYACRGAFIFDITNPDSPVLASWYNPGNNIQFLEAIVIGNRAYFGSGSGAGVHIVDVTNPYSPVLLGVVNQTNANAHNFIHEMVVFNQNGATYLLENYNSTGVKALKVINVTNPAAPVFVRDITPTDPQWVHAMVVKGNRLFTSGWGNSSSRGRTEIYDISNIGSQAPALLGFISDQTSITAGNNMHSAWPSEDGNYLYSCRETNNGSGDVRVYNISNPASPLLVGRVTMNDLGLNAVTPHNPVVFGNYLYVSWYQAGVQVFDISAPATPVRVGQYDTYQPTFAPPSEREVNDRIKVETRDEKKGSRSKTALVDEPWDIICGAERVQNALPNTYDGNWAVYPFLGTSKVLAGDLKYGLLILDASQASAPLRNKTADFDADRRTDLSLMRPASGSWLIESSSSSSAMGVRIRLGQPGDEVVAGDYDGDGRADLAVFRPSTAEWIIKRLRVKERSYFSGQFGSPNDIPIPGDYDADGRMDKAVYHYNATGPTFDIMQSTLGRRTVTFAQSLGITINDRPIVGDYDNDGKADLAVWAPGNGKWTIQLSSSSATVTYFLGQNGDRPVSADFDGNGVTDLAVYRPSTGLWLTQDPITGAVSNLTLGTAEDVAIPSDFDGDGRADRAVFRPSTNQWLWIRSSDGALVERIFGQSGDMPAPLSVQPQ